MTGLIIYFVLIAVAFWALIVLPQRRRVQGMRVLQSSLREGDEIVTTSGIFGRIVGLDDAVAEVEVAPGTVIRLARGAVGQRVGGLGGDEDGGHDAGGTA